MQRMTRKKPESLQEATPTTVQERHKREVSAAAAQQQKQKATNEKKTLMLDTKRPRPFRTKKRSQRITPRILCVGVVYEMCSRYTYTGTIVAFAIVRML